MSDDRMFCDWSPLPDKVRIVYQTRVRLAELEGFPVSLFDSPDLPTTVETVRFREIELGLFCGMIDGIEAYRWYGWDEKTRTVYTTMEFDTRFH